ncbi:purine-nucleoside phosphorylase [Acholeplasma equifetale]|uniref:purine-nucleoside phosphorylase n=1 Tax=Acholeplasma equifetale TaxID=264634 RepID=UPI00138AD210|nr:purine-nucleoside phosphorylase [Acholeplasma equifetale]
MIPTPHIELKDKDLIAKTVLMPGDPLRAKFIAETYLKDVVEINSVRNMFGYTGTYKGKKITVMGSGMGMPSIGIYSYELFKFYDVDTIIRIGSAGAYSPDLKLYDVVLAKAAWSESTYAKTMGVSNKKLLKATPAVNKKIKASAKKLGIPLHESVIHSSDVFYRINSDEYKDIFAKHGAVCVEMESFALFANALATGKNAACLLTISDSLVTHEATSSEERQKAFTKMMEIALNTKL